MPRSSLLAAFAALSVLMFATAALGQEPARPNLVLQELVKGFPKSDWQEVRVLTADIQPGGKTPFHSHRFPVTVYILEGAFTLELEGHAAVVVKAGQSFVEPPQVKMTGYNKSATERLRIVIFYVSDPTTPFLDPQ